MNKYQLLILMLTGLLLQACAVTGPADDGFENSQESLSTGRLFSDDDSGYTIFSTRRQQLTADETEPTTGADDPDYQSYRQWREAKRSNSPEYQKFKLWLEFEAFQRWQQQSQTK